MRVYVRVVCVCVRVLCVCVCVRLQDDLGHLKNKLHALVRDCEEMSKHAEQLNERITSHEHALASITDSIASKGMVVSLFLLHSQACAILIMN